MNSFYIHWELLQDQEYIKKGHQFVGSMVSDDREFIYWYMAHTNNASNRSIKAIGVWKITLKTLNN